MKRVASAKTPTTSYPRQLKRGHQAPTTRRHRPSGHRLANTRRARLLAFCLVPLLSVPLAALWLPVPFLDGFLVGVVTERVAGQVACPGTVAQPPTINVGGGPLLPQLLRGRMSELQLSVPGVTIGGARNVTFDATLRDVSQPEAGTTQVGSMDASITVDFANMPAAPDEPPTTYGRAPDGSLMVETVSRAEDASNVTAKLFLRMELRGETVAVVPQRLQLFGHTLQAERVADLAGGVRTQELPDLPDGVTYKSIIPREDGVHVSLDGVATEPLTSLPTEVDGRPVSYQAKDGLLGISTVFSALDLPLTIFTAPRLTGETLTLVPQSVEILGANRQPDDLLARLVLDQIGQESLSRALPDLPAGVRYRSVSVDDTGINVAVGGVTVMPFSELSAGNGRPTIFGAEDGLLTATTRGGSPDGSPTPVVLYAEPRITDNTLDIAPQEIEMFGINFPARNVLAQVRARDTSYPLPALPANLEYRDVTVLADGLRINMSGKDVLLQRGQLTGTSC